MTLSPTHLAIANLLGNPTLTHQQIGQITGVSRRTVTRVSIKVKQAGGANIELEDYRGLIRKQVPAKTRVDSIQKIVKKADSNPFAAMRAIEYADQVLGLAPKQQQQGGTDGPQPPALFALPPGTRVAMVLPEPNRRQVGDGNQAINITVDGTRK